MLKMNRAVAFLAAVAGISAAANAQVNVNPPLGFFDWDTNTSSGTNFQVSPFVGNDAASVAAADAALAQAQAKGRPLAIKVVSPLTYGPAKNLLNKYKIDYVFCDFETADHVALTKAVAGQVLISAKSQAAFVGNFNVYPNSGSDATRPGVVATSANSYQNVAGTGDYANMRSFRTDGRGNNRMANEALYPGAPDFKNPAAPSSGSTAPNIRSALFALPIVRAGFVTQNLASNNGLNKHIPWVSRFNNWGTSALDSDNNPSNGFTFDTNARPEWNNQLPSRGDFQAQVLHYRLRGADSVNLFEASVSSVVGYDRQTARNDVIAGWSRSPTAGGIFSRKNYAFANLGSMVEIANSSFLSPGTYSSEQAGTLWSGVYDKGGNNGAMLEILLSNLSGGSNTVDLPSKIGGFATTGGDNGTTDDYTIAAGSHRLLGFRLQGGVWQLQGSAVVFGGGIIGDRNGVGIPEPTSLALLGIGAVGLLARRRRNA